MGRPWHRLQSRWNVKAGTQAGDHAALLNDTATSIQGSVVAPTDETASQEGRAEAQPDLL